MSLFELWSLDLSHCVILSSTKITNKKKLWPTDYINVHHEKWKFWRVSFDRCRVLLIKVCFRFSLDAKCVPVAHLIEHHDTDKYCILFSMYCMCFGAVAQWSALQTCCWLTETRVWVWPRSCPDPKPVSYPHAPVCLYYHTYINKAQKYDKKALYCMFLYTECIE